MLRKPLLLLKQSFFFTDLGVHVHHLVKAVGFFWCESVINFYKKLWLVHEVNKRTWRKGNHLWIMRLGRGLRPPSIIFWECIYLNITL